MDLFEIMKYLSDELHTYIHTLFKHLYTVTCYVLKEKMAYVTVLQVCRVRA